MGAAFFGYLAHVVFLSWGSTLYFNSIFIHPNNIALLDGTMIPSFTIESFTMLSVLKYLPLIFIVLMFSIKIMPFFKNSYVNNIPNTHSNVPMSIPYALRDNYNNSSYNESGLASLPKIKKIISFSALTINHFNILNHYIILNFLISSNIVLRYWDRGLVEIMGP